MGGEWNKKYEVNKFGKPVVHSIFTPLKKNIHVRVLTIMYTATGGGLARMPLLLCPSMDSFQNHFSLWLLRGRSAQRPEVDPQTIHRYDFLSFARSHDK